MMEKPLLTISILCSGRRETKQCLDSLNTLREKVPSELILVDTGCDDKMKNLLHCYTEEVVSFAWCNDFAKARNAGLQKAQGAWFMFLDDDEWFLDTKEVEEFFLSGEYKRYGSATYIVRNYLDQNGYTYEDSEPIRMVRLYGGVKFKGIIHERLTPAAKPQKRLRSIAEHYGYVYRTKEEERKHGERNRTLLLKELEEDPENIQIWTHIVQQYRSEKNYGVLQEFCRKGLRKFEDEDSIEINRDRGCFYCGLVEADLGLEDYKTAEADYEKALADGRNTDCCTARLMTFGAEIFTYKKNKRLVAECCRRYFALLQYFETRQEKLYEQDTFSVRQAFHQVMRNNMYSYQICLDLENGNTVSLKKYFDDFGWDSGKVYMTEDFMPCLVKAMVTLPKEEIFVHAADVLANKPRMDNFWEEIDKIEDEAEVRQIVGILSETTGKFGVEAGEYLKKMLTSKEEDDWEGFSATLKKAVAACPQLGGILKRYAQFYAKQRMERAEDGKRAERAEKEIPGNPNTEGLGRRVSEENGVSEGRYDDTEGTAGDGDAVQRQALSAEMEVLAARVKSQINVLLLQDMKKEALQALRQLKTFMPEDEELSELEVRLCREI